jgi:hypothetical protein
MSDITGEFQFSDETREWIATEVKRQIHPLCETIDDMNAKFMPVIDTVEQMKRQMEPVNQSVQEVKQQNREQSTLLAMQVAKIDKLDKWTKQLWSNGSGGPPGYLEVARQEDKEWKAEMFDTISSIQAEGFRLEGRKALTSEQAAEKDRRLGRWKTYAYIAASLGGAWIWTLLRPLLHAMVGYLVKVVQ